MSVLIRAINTPSLDNAPDDNAPAKTKMSGKKSKGKKNSSRNKLDTSNENVSACHTQFSVLQRLTLHIAQTFGVFRCFSRSGW